MMGLPQYVPLLIQLNVCANVVVIVAYHSSVSETMDYFRAVVRAEEKSERALKLTEEVIGINSANYTAWYVMCLPNCC